MDVPVNYIAIVVSAVAAFVFGFLVHGPLFGKVWLDLMKVTPAEMEQGKKDMEKKMPLYMGAAFLQQLVVAYVMSIFVYMAYATSIADALLLAFWLWLGFIATTLLNGVLWEKRTLPLYGFNVAYHFVSLAIIATILTLWQ